MVELRSGIDAQQANLAEVEEESSSVRFGSMEKSTDSVGSVCFGRFPPELEEILRDFWRFGSLRQINV